MSNEERLDEILEKFDTTDLTYKEAKAELTKLIDEERQQLIQRIKEEVIDSMNPRLIDKGNEAYYDQAEGFRLGYNLATQQILETMEKEL